MKSSLLFFIVSLLVLLSGPVGAEAATAGLFDEESVLELSMEVEFDELCRPREQPECGYVPSVLGYTHHGETGSIPVEIQVRGGWRSFASNCRVPLLWVRFSDEETKGTPFEGQQNLPLTTHCGRSTSLDEYSSSPGYRNYEQYLLKEFLAYRLYNLLTDLSLKVRLVRVRYDLPDKPGRGSTHFAFFTEHFESLSARSQMDLLPRNTFDHQLLDGEQADLLALFQFMIGNTDWSIPRQRNTILLLRSDGRQVPVPYDLDMSGLVNAPYAGPPPSLPIKLVTQRYYLGFCHPGIDWNASFNRFYSRQQYLIAEPAAIPGLNKKERKFATRYVERFFRILQSSTRRTELIINACQPWPPSMEDHLSPANLNPGA